MMAAGKPQSWKESAGPGASNPDTRMPSCRRIAFTCISLRIREETENPLARLTPRVHAITLELKHSILQPFWAVSVCIVACKC